jgi:acetyl-CoA carboxylase alpha subunit
MLRQKPTHTAPEIITHFTKFSKNTYNVYIMTEQLKKHKHINTIIEEMKKSNITYKYIQNLKKLQEQNLKKLQEQTFKK